MSTAGIGKDSTFSNLPNRPCFTNINVREDCERANTLSTKSSFLSEQSLFSPIQKIATKVCAFVWNFFQTLFILPKAILSFFFCCEKNPETDFDREPNRDLTNHRKEEKTLSLKNGTTPSPLRKSRIRNAISFAKNYPVATVYYGIIAFAFLSPIIIAAKDPAYAAIETVQHWYNEYLKSNYPTFYANKCIQAVGEAKDFPSSKRVFECMGSIIPSGFESGSCKSIGLTFRKVMPLFHPDKNPDAKETGELISSAYDILRKFVCSEEGKKVVQVANCLSSIGEPSHRYSRPINLGYQTIQHLCKVDVNWADRVLGCLGLDAYCGNYKNKLNNIAHYIHNYDESLFDPLGKAYAVFEHACKDPMKNFPFAYDHPFDGFPSSFKNGCQYFETSSLNKFARDFCIFSPRMSKIRDQFSQLKRAYCKASQLCTEKVTDIDEEMLERIKTLCENSISCIEEKIDSFLNFEPLFGGDINTLKKCAAFGTESIDFLSRKIDSCLPSEIQLRGMQIGLDCW